jgi:hypothetical protein
MRKLIYTQEPSLDSHGDSVTYVADTNADPDLFALVADEEGIYLAGFGSFAVVDGIVYYYGSAGIDGGRERWAELPPNTKRWARRKYGRYAEQCWEAFCDLTGAGADDLRWLQEDMEEAEGRILAGHAVAA